MHFCRRQRLTFAGLSVVWLHGSLDPQARLSVWADGGEGGTAALVCEWLQLQGGLAVILSVRLLRPIVGGQHELRQTATMRVGVDVRVGR